jgi:hypothetical protein
LPGWEPGSEHRTARQLVDPISPPSPATGQVFFRLRAEPASHYTGNKALPMPVRYSPDIHGNVAAVFASQDSAKADPRFSYAPDVAFTESGSRGKSLDLQLSNPRKTSAVDGYRAPKDFQFFSAKLRIANQGSQPVALKLDDLEIHDADGVRYLANPELLVGSWPEPSLGAGAEAQLEVSFLVPEASPLTELAVQEAPGQALLLPLQAR